MSKRSLIDMLAAFAMIALLVGFAVRMGTPPARDYPASKEEAQAAAIRDGKPYFIYGWQIFRPDGTHIGPVL